VALSERHHQCRVCVSVGHERNEIRHSIDLARGGLVAFDPLGGKPCCKSLERRANALALWNLLWPRVGALDELYTGITPVFPGKDPTAAQRAAPRDLRQRGPDEMAQGGGGGGGRGKAGGSGARRRSY
jgi:hypothetical protein